MNLNKYKLIYLGVLSVLVICSIWVGPARQYWFYFSPVSDHEVQEAIHNPSNDIFEASILRLNQASPENHKSAIEIANGIAIDPIHGPRNIKLPFSINDVIEGSGQWQLIYAGLSLPDILLTEFESTGDRRYLLLARDMIYHFLLWEKDLLIYTGFSWNDHALSNRVQVLSRFWYHYRKDQDYDSTIAKEILRGVERTCTRLASPSVFTYNTNHGIMTNLALMEASIAFPTLKNAETWGKIARPRLERQMEFYISQEGIVLEHSPGYHIFGIYLLASIIELDRLSGSRLPSSWSTLLKKAQLAQKWMQRPDGSLPTFGDTSGGPWESASESNSTNHLTADDAQVLKGMYHFSIFPVSGLGGWRTLSPEGDTISHASASWAYFQKNGHSHADELSISLWIDSIAELINSGYWPDGTEGREEAKSWKGSNAPHFIGEQELPSRLAPELIAFSDSLELRGLVMLRKAVQGNIQRQFFQIGKDIWIVLDIFTDMDRHGRGEIIWRVNGNLEHEIKDSGVATWIGKGQENLRGRFLGTRSIKPCPNQMAYAVISNAVKPVSCIALESESSPSAVLSIWSTNSSNQQNADESIKFISANEWEISGIGAITWNKLVRKDNKLTLVGTNNNDVMEVALKEAQDTSMDRLKIDNANLNLGKRFPKYYNLEGYRYRMTYLCIGLAVLQFVFLYFISRRFPRYLNRIVALGAIAWIMLGVYLHTIYFIK